MLPYIDVGNNCSLLVEDSKFQLSQSLNFVWHKNAHLHEIFTQLQICKNRKISGESRDSLHTTPLDVNLKMQPG